MNKVNEMKPCTIYARQKAMAKLRNIEWQLTFEEWYAIWLQSGKYDQRGRGVGKYCMSRIGDTGPYSKNNVFIQETIKNCGDKFRGVPQTPEFIAKRVSKIKGVKHSPERRLANSLGQKNGKNIFVLRSKNKQLVGI